VKIPEQKSFDVLVIGSGPSGLAAAVTFKRAGLHYVHIESGRLAQTIFNFPSNMRLYSHRSRIEINGIPFMPEPDKPPTREEYLDYLSSIVLKLQLEVLQYTEAVSLVNGPVHTVRTRNLHGERLEIRARNVVIASGGFYKPVLLGIPGEGQENVSHYLNAKLRAAGKRILVVGGRNSAIEAAVLLAKSGAKVTLAYRGARLPHKNIKPWLLPDLEKARKRGEVSLLYRTIPNRIQEKVVVLIKEGQGKRAITVDEVFLLTGYGPDSEFLKNAGVGIHRKTGRPLCNPHTLQTRIPGLFLCGTVMLRRYGARLSIENTRSHGEVILSHLRQ
jgi:thioredoxin reductase (NADPH)